MISLSRSLRVLSATSWLLTEKYIKNPNPSLRPRQKIDIVILKKLSTNYHSPAINLKLPSKNPTGAGRVFACLLLAMCRSLKKDLWYVHIAIVRFLTLDEVTLHIVVINVTRKQSLHEIGNNTKEPAPCIRS